ncbi:MAG TPA: hypothetical protein VJN92_09800 [Candidatus Acidoferrum sp.]|nr:hypothetical protein [Candidatus Acidoferrum sp.]
MRSRGDLLLTASFAFGDVLDGVYRRGAADRAKEASRTLQELIAEVVDFTVEAADHYAQI